MTSIRLTHQQAKPRDRQKERLVRMTQVIQSFASGFTLRPISVKLVNGGQAPAFSSSNGIWFHEGMVGDLTTKRGVVSLKGLTLHEISHILLSPRAGSEFRQWAIDHRLNRAWNALEDQRIESQLIALYPSIRDWFDGMIGEYLLKSPQQWRLAFPLIHGRKYLDPQVRGIVKKAFKYPERVAELSRIIDEYRTLNFTNDDDIEIAKVLIEQYHELTKDLRIDNPNGHDHRSETEGETNVKSRPLPKKRQAEASDRVEQEEPEEEWDDSDYEDFDWDSLDDEPEQDEDEAPEGAGNSSGSDDSDDEDEDSDDEDEDSDDEDEDSDDEDEDSDDDSDDWDWDDEDADEDTESEGESSETEASSSDSHEDSDNGAGKGDAKRELERLLNEALQETLERLEDKIANDIDLYNGDVLLEGETLPEPDQYEGMQQVTVSAGAVKASEEFAHELNRLRAEHDPAWVNRVSSGRINPSRWEQGCEFDEAFDRFEQGHSSATDIEAVILLDVSGSMRRDETPAHESMWAIKSALDNINASTSVIAYSDKTWSQDNSAFTLYSNREKVGREMNFIPCIGGTNPTRALQYAQGVLANTNRAIKLLIVITDGEWETNCLERTEEIIRTMRDGGVLTSLAWLSRYDIDFDTKNLHGAEIVCHVRDASDLFNLGRSIVEVGIQRQLTH